MRRAEVMLLAALVCGCAAEQSDNPWNGFDPETRRAAEELWEKTYVPPRASRGEQVFVRLTSVEAVAGAAALDELLRGAGGRELSDPALASHGLRAVAAPEAALELLSQAEAEHRLTSRSRSYSVAEFSSGLVKEAAGQGAEPGAPPAKAQPFSFSPSLVARPEGVSLAFAPEPEGGAARPALSIPSQGGAIVGRPPERSLTVFVPKGHVVALLPARRGGGPDELAAGLLSSLGGGKPSALVVSARANR